MTEEDTIFVQIPAYRDAECAATLRDLFAKAHHPQRVHVGICWQYKGSEDAAAPPLPESYKDAIRIRALPVVESEGASWAKHQAQQLYDGEDYVLMIDSHMRFVEGWDAAMIAQLASCASAKPVLSHLPPGYVPPSAYDANAKLIVLRAHYPTAGGDIRFRGEPLDTAPNVPLRGAFAAPGFVFAKGALCAEVPCDPYLYFEQEEMCFSARLFTHGWDVYHPSALCIFHLYDSAPSPHPRHKHWNDHPRWSEFNRRGRERADHLLGVQLASSAQALAEMDRYGHGEARSLDQYAAFCGIHFAAREVTQRALTCGFIAGLDRYRAAPILSPATPVPTKPDMAVNRAPASSGRKPRPSTFSMDRVYDFKPASNDILRVPIYLPPAVELRAPAPLPQQITQGIPPGILVIENYAPPELCTYLREHADRTAGVKLKVVDNDRSTGNAVVTKVSDGRITEYVSINDVAVDILGIFNDVYGRRLAPYYGVTFEWYERPQILRYSTGGKYDPHADAEHLNAETKIWMRSLDRDISVLLYLNEDYEGGAVSFDKFAFKIQPKAGMLLAFPSDHRYLHAALPVTRGTRYVIVSWASTVGSPRVRDSAPYASVTLHLPA